MVAQDRSIHAQCDWSNAGGEVYDGKAHYYRGCNCFACTLAIINNNCVLAGSVFGYHGGVGRDGTKPRAARPAIGHDNRGAGHDRMGGIARDRQHIFNDTIVHGRTARCRCMTGKIFPTSSPDERRKRKSVVEPTKNIYIYQPVPPTAFS